MLIDTDVCPLSHAPSSNHSLASTTSSSSSSSSSSSTSSSSSYRCWSSLVRVVGHRGEVNQIRWDVSGCYLASVSDDGTVKVWDPHGELLHHFTHNAGVAALAWCTAVNFGLFPHHHHQHHQHEHHNAMHKDKAIAKSKSMLPTLSSQQIPSSASSSSSSSSSSTSSKQLGHFQGERESSSSSWCGVPLLATGGFDATIRLWDVSRGTLVSTMKRHAHPVTQLAYNPYHHLLAAAAHHRAYIWNCVDGSLVRTWTNGGEGGINELAWDCQERPHTDLLNLNRDASSATLNSKGNRLFAAYSDGNSYVLTIKPP